MTDEDGKYNGWANRETWAVNLHLTNNEGDYNHYRMRAREIRRSELDYVAELAKEIKSDMSDVRFAVFEAAKKSGLVPDAAVLLLQDMCDFDDVDWFEVASTFMDEVKAEHKTPFRKHADAHVKP